MVKTNKKGFTLTELLIVIVIIAILLAVLIPVLTSYVKRARVATEKEIVKNVNLALSRDEEKLRTGKNHTTMHEALKVAFDYGYDIALINEKSKTGYEILWDSKNDVFCYLNKENEKIEYIPEYPAKNHAKNVDLWQIKKVDGDGNLKNETYSIYAAEGSTASSITTDKGFDAGNCKTITIVNYDRSFATEDQNVVIRTNSVLTDLTIDAKLDTINHFGDVGKVDIAKIDMDCYNECGYSIYIKIIEGKVVAKDNGVINIVFADNTDGGAVAVIKEDSGTINSGYTRVQQVDTTNQARVDGIELKYAIYIDENTPITGEQFVTFVESTANYAVNTEKKAEEAIQKEQQAGPIGSFADPFVIEEVNLTSSDLVAGNSYYFDVDGFYDEDDNEMPIDDDLTDIIQFFKNEEIADVYSNSNDVASVEYEEITGAVTIYALSEGTATITVEFDDDETIMSFDVVIVSSGEEPVVVGNLCKIERTGTEYDDITQAVAAAQTGDKIVILRDEDSIPYFQSRNDKSVTLDLNGHFIKNLSIENISVAIIDSSESKTGRIEKLWFDCNYGVENPSFVWNPLTDDVERNDYHEGQGYHYLDMWCERPAKLSLLGGSIKSLHLMYCADVEVAGAQIINTDEKTSTTGYAISAGQHKYISLNIKSGIIIGERDINYIGSVSISGGYFNSEVPAKQLAAGYKCVKISDGLYQVVAK